MEIRIISELKNVAPRLAVLSGEKMKSAEYIQPQRKRRCFTTLEIVTINM